LERYGENLSIQNKFLNKNEFEKKTLKVNLHQAWWCTPVIPAFRRLRQEYGEFKGSLNYIGRPCQFISVKVQYISVTLKEYFEFIFIVSKLRIIEQLKQLDRFIFFLIFLLTYFRWKQCQFYAK
jgi:hypothetical protein